MATRASGMKKQVWRGKKTLQELLKYQQWARTHTPDIVYDLYWVVMMVYLHVFHRLKVEGIENVPTEGAVIIVPNHFSFMDHFFVGIRIRRRVRFMAKSQLFDRSPLAWMFKHGGVFPVARGQRDEDAFETADILLRSGQAVIMYVQAGRSRTYELSERIYPGVGKLANRTGMPIVPVAVYGTQFIRDWKRGRLFPKVRVKYGEPIRDYIPSYKPDQEISDQVFAEIKKLYSELELKAR